MDPILLKNLRVITKTFVEEQAVKGILEINALIYSIKAFLEAVQKKPQEYAEFKQTFVEVIKLDYPHLLDKMSKYIILF